MKIAGIICEYNPFHLGHGKQIRFLKDRGYAVVCLMSGNFVQRGAPAIFDKAARARAAVDCGADLVLELPVTYALSSAEGFAAGGVEILSKVCDTLCFGAETADAQALLQAARVLLQPEFSLALRTELGKGVSFPAARAAALETLGVDRELVETPNNILAVEYCKAVLSQDSKLEILPIFRPGSYHETTADAENPSASSLRILIKQKKNWGNYVPQPAFEVQNIAQIHATEFGERAILTSLRTLSEEAFEDLPYGSEGLWRKLMHASRKECNLESIATATKSKRYTRSRIDRMLLCAFLGLTERDFKSPVPYCRILGFNDTGRAILSQARENGFFANIGSDTHHPYQALERRCDSLYGLFSQDIEPPDAHQRYRVYYSKSTTKV